MITTKPNPNMPPDLPPQVAMMQMLGGLRVARLIYAAAELGIADLLADGSQTVEELAQATGTHAPSLYRLMRSLASVGIFAEYECHFSLTPLAEFLQSDSPDSVRAAVKFFGQDWHWNVWENLHYSVKTGEPAFEYLYKQGLFEFYQDPEVARVSSESKASISQRAAQSLLANYDFSLINKVVDIGIFASGSTVISLLQANPTMQGVLFDYPSAIAAATSVIESAKVADRCELIAGNCLDSVPSGGDAYILMFVVHNWDDNRAVQLLKNCREVMSADGRLLIVEMIMPLGNQPFVGKLIDLESLLTTPGGYERTEAQYRSLLASAGFQVTRIIPTQTANSIIEAVRA
ncbi:acetylserotonin O-methyltransferase [Gloeocapsopsis crepidinum]|nr:acetylserotonin O-methyltransferase [Gloeocapsopsis crepidinum]